jgi:hypothetical protein
VSLVEVAWQGIVWNPTRGHEPHVLHTVSDVALQLEAM